MLPHTVTGKMPCLCFKNDNRPSPVSETRSVIIGLATLRAPEQGHLNGHMSEDGAERAHKSGAKPLRSPGKTVTAVTGIRIQPDSSERKS
jgi:hypothetical protein